MPNEQDDEIIIDIDKTLRILNQRKVLIVKVFMTCILILVAFALIWPKKYKTYADLYINKGNDTNLAEMNPYIISSITDNANLSSMLGGGNGGNLQNEIEIMKSPLVMDQVIKENKLVYKGGKKKGEYLSTEDFLRKNISIENKKGTKIIEITYKSRKPLQSYNVVNSIIKNYEAINEELNTNRALKDKELLEAVYEDTNKTLNKKLAAIKSSPGLPDSALSGMGMLAALKGHNRAVSGALGSLQGQIIEGKKSQISIEQEAGKLNLVKSKLEWTNLVEKLSKDRTNVIVLKQPEIKRGFEQASPKLFVNIVIGIFLGIFASIIAVIVAEVLDKRLTYSDLGNKIIYNVIENPDELKIFLLTHSKENISIVTFDGSPMQNIKNDGVMDFRIIKADISKRTVEEIINSDKLVFAAKIGQTSKKLYQQLKNMCKEANKDIPLEVI